MRAIGTKFSLIFGAAEEPIAERTPDSHDLIGMAWLYALHARSSIGRGRLLQAEIRYADSGLASKLESPLQRIAQCLVFE